MESLRNRYILSIHNGFGCMTKSHMYAGLRKPCMVSNMPRGCGTQELIAISRAWDLPRLAQDSNLYFILIESKPLILMPYVEDLIIIGAEMLIASCKAYLAI